MGRAALVLFAEALGIVVLNGFPGVVADRRNMSPAGPGPDVAPTSSKTGGIVFGLHSALCGPVALLVAVRDRAPAGLGRILLIGAVVVHALLGAVTWGLVGPPAFLPHDGRPRARRAADDVRRPYGAAGRRRSRGRRRR